MNDWDRVAAGLPQLPPAMQAAADAAIRMVKAAREQPGGAQKLLATRDVEQRRRYAPDPWAYARDVFGYRLTPQEERLLELGRKNRRLLIPSAKGLGKTFLVSLDGLHSFDCVAALPDERGNEQGCFLLLAAPSSPGVWNLYRALAAHAALAESRGFGMPGVRSDKSVLWNVRPDWLIEGVHPPKSIVEQQAHKAAGRHHRNLVVLADDSIGIAETMWRTLEGDAVGASNRILAPFNPTESFGPTRSRESSGEYFVLRLSALDHPNIQQRREVVPGAVSHDHIDAVIRVQCTDVGPWPQVAPNPEHDEFVYALPPKPPLPEGWRADPAPRMDGVPGHASAVPHVYRPGPWAKVEVLGRTGNIETLGLFREEALLESGHRYAARAAANTLPTGPPSLVGADPAREGNDDATACPRWGQGGVSTLQAYREAERAGAHHVDAFRLARRVVLGRIVVFPKGDGVQLANNLRRTWPKVPYSLDSGGIGVSSIDHLRFLGDMVAEIAFGAGPPQPPLDGMLWAMNYRTFMYQVAAMLWNLGLVDAPTDDRLHEEFLAHELLPATRTVPNQVGSETVNAVVLISKDEIKKRIGRSPDYADAVVVALAEPVVAGMSISAPGGKGGRGAMNARYGPAAQRGRRDLFGGGGR